MTITNKIYFLGTTVWLVTLAKIADFNPFEHMTDLTGQGIFY